jgi:hypothetical protein
MPPAVPALGPSALRRRSWPGRRSRSVVPQGGQVRHGAGVVQGEAALDSDDRASLAAGPHCCGDITPTLAVWASGSRPLWELLRAVPPPRQPTSLS